MLGHKVPDNWRELIHEAYEKPYKECSWQEKEVRRDRSKKVAQALAARILDRLAKGRGEMWPIQEDFDKWGEKYRPHQESPQATLKLWYKQPLFKAQIVYYMHDLLDKLGITEERALTLLAKNIEAAEAEGASIGDRNQVFDRMDKVLGMTSGKVTEEIGFDYTRAVSGREQGRMRAKRTRQLRPGEIDDIQEIEE